MDDGVVVRLDACYSLLAEIYNFQTVLPQIIPSAILEPVRLRTGFLRSLSTVT